jgi:endonuclease/exonuclease/phosphatase family metal-dependent hydrolase
VRLGLNRRARRKAAVLLLILTTFSGITQTSGDTGDFRERIWRGGAALRQRRDARELKLLSWNIERGRQFREVAAALTQGTPDVLLLQEVDVHARRSGLLDIPKELARQLEMSYTFAAEFEELGQGTSAAPAYHRQAVLALPAIRSASIVRFSDQSGFWHPRWYLPNWAIFQRRIGGRLALAVEIETGAHILVAYNVHLESRGPEALRLRQMQEVLAHANRYAATAPIVIAGDLNVSGPSSPVIQAVLEAGFRKAVGGEVTTARGSALDWVFVRGELGFAEGMVHRDTRASDHYPLTVRLTVGQ